MKKMLKITQISAALVVALVFGFTLSTGLTASAATAKTVELTQTSAVLGLGQKITVIATNAKTVRATSNSRAVKATVTGGNQITLLGSGTGSVRVTVCSTGFNCSVISVKAQRTKNAVLTLSKSNPTMKVGESITVTTKNGSDINARSNFSGVRVNVIDSKIVLNALFAGKGTITVCSSNRGCLPIYVKVQALPRVLGIKIKADETPKTLRVSQTNLTLQKNQSGDVMVESRDKLTATSDSNVARTAVNSNRITIYGTEIGTANVKICDTKTACATVRVKVNPSNTGAFEVYPTNIAIETGQSTLINTKNRSKISTWNDTWSVRTSVKDSLVQVTGVSAGKGKIWVCSGDECVPVNITVKTAVTPRTVTGNMKTVYLDVSQTTSFTIPWREPTSWYVTRHSNPDAVSLDLNSKTVTLKALKSGAASIELCPLLPEFDCATIGVNVSKNYYCGNAKTFQLSETDVTIRQGQTVDIFPSICGGLSVISDSEQIVRTSMNENRITLYGMASGEAEVYACTSKFVCDSVRVRVTN